MLQQLLRPKMLLRHISKKIMDGWQKLLDWVNTEWKFYNFCITQILRGINFGDSRCAKSAILRHLEALHSDCYEFLHFVGAEIWQINKIQRTAVSEPLDSPKLISRKIWMIGKSWYFHTVLKKTTFFGRIISDFRFRKIILFTFQFSMIVSAIPAMDVSTWTTIPTMDFLTLLMPWMKSMLTHTILTCPELIFGPYLQLLQLNAESVSPMGRIATLESKYLKLVQGGPFEKVQK